MTKEVSISFVPSDHLLGRVTELVAVAQNLDWVEMVDTRLGNNVAHFTFTGLSSSSVWYEGETFQLKYENLARGLMIVANPEFNGGVRDSYESSLNAATLAQIHLDDEGSLHSLDNKLTVMDAVLRETLKIV